MSELSADFSLQLVNLALALKLRGPGPNRLNKKLFLRKVIALLDVPDLL